MVAERAIVTEGRVELLTVDLVVACGCLGHPILLPVKICEVLACTPELLRSEVGLATVTVLVHHVVQFQRRSPRLHFLLEDALKGINGVLVF